jgi:hypothetical protein
MVRGPTGGNGGANTAFGADTQLCGEGLSSILLTLAEQTQLGGGTKVDKARIES